MANFLDFSIVMVQLQLIALMVEIYILIKGALNLLNSITKKEDILNLINYFKKYPSRSAKKNIPLNVLVMFLKLIFWF